MPVQAHHLNRYWKYGVRHRAATERDRRGHVHSAEFRSKSHRHWRAMPLQFSGGQPLRGGHVKADPRKVQVHFADRGIFVPDDDFIGRPGEYAPCTGLP